jgi:N,N'-diacetyllegionaminate synthase
MKKNDKINASKTPAWLHKAVCPYMIAEAGVNHNGDPDLALKMVDAAWSVGADAVKFQAFSADELVVKDAAKAEYQKACGQAGESQYDMLARYELTENDFEKIARHCCDRGVDFVITPFSARWTNFFADLAAEKTGGLVSAFKVGSGNLAAPILLRAIAQTRRPIILSTGMSDMAEVHRTIELMRNHGCEGLALMHCISLYPTKLEQTNLYAMRVLSRETGLPVGFSDHTREIMTGGLAVAAGATILEKHFTLDKNMIGPDHAMSLDVDQLREYVAHARLASQACGCEVKRPLAQEQAIRDAVRMSVVSTVAIPPGTVITREMLTEKRPGTGIPAEYLERLIGAFAAQNISENQMIQPADILNYSRLSADAIGGGNRNQSVYTGR